MTTASHRQDARTEPRFDRLHPWIAALSSALLHLLALLLAMTSEPITMSNPDGAAGGSAIEVSFIDVTHDIPSPPEFPSPAPTPPRDPVPPRPDAAQPPAASRVQATPVVRAEDPVPPDADEARDAATTAPASQAPTSRPRQHVWGQPPGMLPEDHAPVNAGPARSPAVERGRRYNASAAEPNLEVGGFQVIYDLRSEAKLRTWQEEGMTELFLPLPGVQQYMVCPLETALRRGSGPCRLVDPEDPEMAAIGDAREVLTMHQVYRRGDLVWKGPGPYR